MTTSRKAAMLEDGGFQPRLAGSGGASGGSGLLIDGLQVPIQA